MIYRLGSIDGVFAGDAAAAATTAVSFVGECEGRRSLAPCYLG
jgi:hypothetical protein